MCQLTSFHHYTTLFKISPKQLLSVRPNIFSYYQETRMGIVNALLTGGILIGNIAKSSKLKKAVASGLKKGAFEF